MFTLGFEIVGVLIEEQGSPVGGGGVGDGKAAFGDFRGGLAGGFADPVGAKTDGSDTLTGAGDKLLCLVTAERRAAGYFHCD